MNARHAYELIRVKFPVFLSSSYEWQVLAHGDAGDIERVEKFLHSAFSSEELVVCISRKVGGSMSINDAAREIVAALGKAEIRIANRPFTEFAVIGHPGVGASWKESGANA
jgi:hypothetical protein